MHMQHKSNWKEAFSISAQYLYKKVRFQTAKYHQLSSYAVIKSGSHLYIYFSGPFCCILYSVLGSFDKGTIPLICSQDA